MQQSQAEAVINIAGRARVLGLMLAGTAAGQGISETQGRQEPVLPYAPSLDHASMDKLADPCVNIYQYACRRWKKNNPIPGDHTSWPVYRKLYEDNLQFLHGILEQASIDNEQRESLTRQPGDFYAACMDEAAVEKQGLAPLRSYLNSVAGLKFVKELAPLAARLQMFYGRSLLFRGSSTKDLDDSEQVIAEVGHGGRWYWRPAKV